MKNVFEGKNGMKIELNMCKCPFRIVTTIKQTVDENGVPMQIQEQEYPECQYTRCPYFNTKATETSKCCNKVNCETYRLIKDCDEGLVV